MSRVTQEMTENCPKDVVKERQSQMVIALLRKRIMTAKRGAVTLFDGI
jgi:hypothetical protein